MALFSRSCCRFIASFLFSAIALTFVIGLPAQEKDHGELTYTERLSKQFPDSAFVLLKEMYTRSILKKDRLSTGICLQQMGEICYYLGSYPKALDYHLQADKIFRE